MKIYANERLNANVTSFDIGTVYVATYNLPYAEHYFKPEALQKNGRYKGKLVEVTEDRRTGTLTKYRGPINKTAHPTHGGPIWKVADINKVPRQLK